MTTGWRPVMPEFLPQFLMFHCKDQVLENACSRDCCKSSDAAGADPTVRSEEGRTLLHSAAYTNKNPAIVTALAQAGGDVNARDKEGFTPLHLAAQYNQEPSISAALLAAGANPDSPDDSRRTALHWAAGSNVNPAVTVALLEAGAGQGGERQAGQYSPALGDSNQKSGRPHRAPRCRLRYHGA